MIQYVIYDHPKDFPNYFVVRRFIIEHGEIMAERKTWEVGSLAKCRDSIPSGLSPIPALQEDDPVILEVWL